MLGTGWQRFRFRLVSPRAAAHVWGKGARILTEINRLPQSIQLVPLEKQAEVQPWTACRGLDLAAFFLAAQPWSYKLDAARGLFDSQIA